MSTTQNRRFTNSTRLAVIATLASLMFACGGGSGSGGGGNPPGITTSTFSGTNNNPGANTVSLSAAGSAGLMFSVDVLVTDVDDFFGAEFDITYNDAVLDFISMDTTGSFLNGQGAATDFRTLEQSGRVQITATLQGQVPGVDAVGSQTLVRLTFNGTAATNNSAIGFTSPTVDQCPPGGPPLPACTDISGMVTFSGGNVTVN